jgi:hypothetical protein
MVSIKELKQAIELLRDKKELIEALLYTYSQEEERLENDLIDITNDLNDFKTDLFVKLLEEGD